MNDEKIDKALLKQERGFSLVWFIPVLAFIVSGWLIYNEYMNSGVEIQIEFDTGTHLVAGKTPLKYLGIEVGQVKDITINNHKPNKVVVIVELKKQASVLAKKGMIYWIAKPRINLNHISGMETILSGAYIEVKPPSYDINEIKKLPTQKFFIGKNSPPLLSVEEQGVHIKFQSNTKGELKSESGIYFKDIKVGHILNFKLNKKHKTIDYDAVIYHKYSWLLEKDFCLWRLKFIDIDTSLKGIDFDLKSLSFLYMGGVELGILRDRKKNVKRRVYHLYESKKLAISDLIKKSKAKKINLISKELHNISVASPIFYKKFPVGEIIQYDLSQDGEYINVQGIIYAKYKHLIKEESVFWLLSGPELEVKTDSIKIHTPSVKALFTGGIEFKNVDIVLSQNEITKGYIIHNSVKEMNKFINSKTPGLRVILHSKQKNSLEYGSPIHYRQVVVGYVQDVGLSKDAKEVEIKIFIENKYKHLLYSNSKFWKSGSMSADFSLFRGLKIETESLKTIIKGGVSFATPEENRGVIAKNKDIFVLYEEPKEKWINWNPALFK